MKAQTPTYRNVSVATFAGLEKLFSKGKVLDVRGHEIREIRNNVLVLSRPLERCLFVPNRRNNVFISIAETMWVLAGRNDIGWLKAYLPSAGDYSGRRQHLEGRIRPSPASLAGSGSAGKGGRAFIEGASDAQGGYVPVRSGH